MRKESPCATITKCIGASSHSEKGASEWVKAYGAGIRRFCMHALCHTYATRAIESGMQPKVLQKLLGHASIKTTMDRYVHVTNDSMSKAVLQFEKVQQNQNGTVSAVQVPKTLEK